jgi:hypothetical protein
MLRNLLSSTWVSMERGNGCHGLVDQLLGFAIDQCQPGCPLNPKSFADRHFASIAIATLRQDVTKVVLLPTQVLNYAMSQGIPMWWNFDLFGLNPYSRSSEDCSESDCCHQESEEFRLRLTASIFSLFIEATFSPRLGLTQGCIPPTMLSPPIQQLENPRLAKFRLNCSYNRAVHGSTGRLSAGNATSIGGGRHIWGQKLANDLQTAALDSQELIIRHVNSICRNLETRCNTVEERLQEALAKATVWQSELDATNAKLTATSLQKAELEDHLLQTCEALAA